MASGTAIKEYLVSLGFAVDNAELRKFSDAMRRIADVVEHYTTNPVFGIASMFVKTGAVAAGVLTTLTGATIGLLSHVANSDLDMQMFARRMFMSTAAARDMKTATDALGVSLEDIIWGPPELRERYSQLMRDDSKMGLGADWELQMRHIRDVEFEFKRLQNFFERGLIPYLTADIAKAFFGDSGSLEANLKKFNDELSQDKIKGYAQAVSDTLVPVLKIMVDLLKSAADNAKLLWGFAQNPHKMRSLFGDTVGDIVENSILGSNPDDFQKRAWWGGDPNWRHAGRDVDPGMKDFANRYGVPSSIFEKYSKSSLESMADDVAKQYGIPASLFKAIIKRESSWNANATNPDSHAFGLSQLMPFNMHAFGMDGSDPQQNMLIGARLLRQFLDESRGNVPRALQSYGGFTSKKTIDELFPGYYNDIMRFQKDYQGGGLQPQAQHTTINVGGVHVEKTNASPDEIGEAVVRKINEKQKAENQRQLVQYGGVFA